MKNWIYNKQQITCINDMQSFMSPGKKVWGFVYHLTLVNKKTGKIDYFYIGKKNLYSVTSKTATKKEMSEFPKSHFRRTKTKGGTLKYYRTVIKESNWRNYCSSNNFIKINKDDYNIIREIVYFSSNDSELTYLEAKEIICSGAIEDPNYLNDAVSIRRFGKKLIT